MDYSILGQIGSGLAVIFSPLDSVHGRPAPLPYSDLWLKRKLSEHSERFTPLPETPLEWLRKALSPDSLPIAEHFTQLSAYSFLVFNLLCAPCFAAIGAIKREMNNAKWTWAAIGYQCGFAYAVSLMVYQLGGLIIGEVAFGVGSVAAIIVLIALIYLLFRKGYQAKNVNMLRAVDAVR